MVPIRGSAHWCREPNGNGSGAIAFQPTDAYFIMQRGHAIIDGVPVYVDEQQSFDDLWDEAYENKRGTVHLHMRFVHKDYTDRSAGIVVGA